MLRCFTPQPTLFVTQISSRGHTKQSHYLEYALVKGNLWVALLKEPVIWADVTCRLQFTQVVFLCFRILFIISMTRTSVPYTF